MSHVATIDIDVKDLDALNTAARVLGMELVQGQTTYHWYGTHVGDYPLPTGFTVDDLGKCDHALRAIGETPETPNRSYEVGVIRSRDGRPGYTLIWDFFDWKLRERLGDASVHLKREYALAVTRKQAIANGFRLHEHRQADGSIRLQLTR